MIGKFQLLMVEPQAFVEAWHDIRYKIGFSEGRPVLSFPQWKMDLDSCLSASQDVLKTVDIDDCLLNSSGELFYSPQLKSWSPQKTYCENSTTIEGVDIVVDSTHNCQKCISPSECKTDKRLNSKKFRRGAFERNIDGIKAFFEPFLSNSNKFLIVDYIFGKKFHIKSPTTQKKAGKVIQVGGKSKREDKHQWESIPDLINFILSEKSSSRIEIHTCCEDQNKGDLVQYLVNKVGVGKKVEIHSWHDNSFVAPNETDTPHDRYFITESSGVQLGSGFDYGKKTSFTMLTPDDVVEEHKCWVKETSPYKHLWKVSLP